MISILVPTRHRPELLGQMIYSAIATANNKKGIEFIVYISDDDDSYDGIEYPEQVKIIRGPRKTLSLCYDWQNASGDIFMLANDDILFHTRGWDSQVEIYFSMLPDHIGLCYGDDGDPNTAKTNAAFPFIHRRWVEVVGKYLPPYFSGDFVDTWLTDIADMIGRKSKLDMYIEHLHPAFNKRDNDTTDTEKWDLHFKDNMPQKYIDTLPERIEDANKLLKYIAEYDTVERG